MRARDASDHPLALHATSKWATFFRDAEVMEQIDRDVMRTHPDMHFFRCAGGLSLGGLRVFGDGWQR